MKQLTLATTGFERYAKTTRRAAFLAEMERVVPWSALCGLIEPFYPKPGNGRPPVGVERMLRIYFLQQWFNLSDPAVEEALYDSRAMRDFAGIDLGREPVPDETTVCRFRHLLEAHDLGRRLFDEVQRHLAANGLTVATGTIVDATIINAPSSTKNAGKARDPEMHQTKKGQQWYFGMKGHFGVDSRSKLIHAVVTTPANVADSTVLPDLLHGQETRVWGDQAYRGQKAIIKQRAGGHLQSLRRQVPLHLIKQLPAEIVLFEQMAEAAHRRLIRHRLAAEVDANKTPHRPRIVKRFFHRRVRQIEPLLQKVDPQHSFHPDRRAAIAGLGIKRFDQRAQRRPRHDALHFIEKRRPPRCLGVTFKPHCRQPQLLHPPNPRALIQR